MGDNLLITGSTGWIGSLILEKLTDSEVPFKAAVTNTIRKSKFAIQNIDSAILNYYQPETLTSSLHNIDVLFLSFPLQEQMVKWSEEIIAASQHAGVKHIVLLSCIGADEASPYLMLRTYGAIEKKIISSGISYTFVRPCLIMQSFSTYFDRTIRLFNALYLPCGTYSINFIDARDVANVCATILQNPAQHQNKSYELTGLKPINMFITAEIIARFSGKCVNYYPVSEEKTIGGLQQLKLTDFFIESLVSYIRFCAANETFQTNCVAEITGHLPVKFEKYVLDYVKAWK